MIDKTKEKVLLQVLFGANDGLVSFFTTYSDLESVANAEQEMTPTEHGSAAGETADATAGAFGPTARKQLFSYLGVSLWPHLSSLGSKISVMTWNQSPFQKTYQLLENRLWH